MIMGKNTLNDYHDYVINDGKFIGKFDQMYQECEDPWLQTKEAGTSYSRWDTIRTIRNHGLKNILECGCGLGYFTKVLTDECPESRITGMDISENAVKRASEMFPKISFCTGNANELGKKIKLDDFDGIIFAEIMWYILDDAKKIIANLKENYKGILIINQVFYHNGQEYGKEAYTNEAEMAAYLGIKPIVQNKYQKGDSTVAYETHNVFKFE